MGLELFAAIYICNCDLNEDIDYIVVQISILVNHHFDALKY